MVDDGIFIDINKLFIDINKDGVGHITKRMLRTDAKELVHLTCNQRLYSYAKMSISATSPRDLNEVTPPGGRRARKP